ncbi:E3 ubiquitin-protein ligase MYCBP2 [Maniola jurtina]|uniref:E3 ubiquitin-protein ligase MYCBP2 n=1 Tax=Maniola jurtina TaxID=191418 RepID=UPI001E68C8A1|nr:E3 ubiquitin-protein ligase MYCBP2 [Maniola jurtina]
MDKSSKKNIVKMDEKIDTPELKCMDVVNYRKYFRTLCWGEYRGIDRIPKKVLKSKDKLKKWRAPNPLATCFAPSLLGNPSHFAAFATVRRTILARSRELQAAVFDLSDDSEGDNLMQQVTVTNLPKITCIGLRTVFALISEARFSDAQFCEQSLKALLDVLQGHAPEDLGHEPSEIMSNLHIMLVEISGGTGPTGRLETPSALTALSSSCLIALAVARGEAELVLGAVTSLIMAPPSLTEQNIQIPTNLTILQRSVQSVILGSPSRNLWLNYGVPHKSLITSFPVDLPSQLTIGSGELVVRALVSDGCFLYVYTSKGLLKIGSGYGSSIRQHVYLYNPDFFASDRHGWLGYCRNKLYVRIGRKKSEVLEVDKDTLEVKSVLHLDTGHPGPSEPKSAIFTDSNQLGSITLSNYDNLIIKMYDVETSGVERTQGARHTLTARREFHVHLLRRRTLVLGRPPFDDGLSRRMVDLDAPVAMQLDDNDDDPLVGISSGQDFGLLTTSSGKVYYTGKGTTLGYKVPSPHTGRWTLIKETLFNKNEAPNIKKSKVVQVALGHEGVHAILVLDNGSALFTGIARRGEDGDAIKHRRTPKPTRPKKILRAEKHHVIYAACNYGSTALVTRSGELLMFGKDTQHCDENGLVTDLRDVRVIQVALGKAHAVALTNFGEVYTFGINNKGQCGREFGYTREKPYRSTSASSGKEEARLCVGVHSWSMEYCRVCVLCRECTGFASACSYAASPNRLPGEKCGCGEGDPGCTICGACRRCAEASTSGVQKSRTDQSAYNNEKDSSQSEGETGSGLGSAGTAGSGPDSERETVKVNCLPPARVVVPGGHRINAVACGLHHTMLLSELGEVFTFGSNQWGALGAGDLVIHHRVVRVRVPRAMAVAAGSNHSAVLTRDGEVYTFGSYQKGSLGRARQEEPRSDRSPVWYATPGRLPNIGTQYGCRAVWVTASGDQTFVQVSQALINTDTLFSSTITANSNSIVILPNRPEHTFKCITINKSDGSCNAWTGPEQVDFVNTLACLDPLYDVLWCYQPQMRVMKCFNILAFDSHKLQRCCSNDPEAFSDVEFEYPNYGCMKRLEDFRQLENFEWISNKEDQPADNIALSNMSVLNQELAIPCTPGCQVTRIHAALHLLGCLDSLTYAHETKPSMVECKRDNAVQPIISVVEDYLTVNRFENHGAGWGYSGHSVEAIRFMCDSDILLGGVGLYGGRGDYTAKIHLFDIGTEGGDQEGDGELMFETDEIFYECAPKDKYPLMFESPVALAANRWYVVSATINGPSSDCGSSGQATVINDDIGFHFKTSKKSNNGTDVNGGQIPCLLYNTMGPDHPMPIKHLDPAEPVIVLSKNLSRKVTVSCFRSLIVLLRWSWKTFKEIILDTNGQLPINIQKLTIMKHQKRLVYIIRAALRLVKSYIKEVYPQSIKKRNALDYMSYFESIADVRNFIQSVIAEETPTCAILPRKQRRSKPHRLCYVQFALEMTHSILQEAHDTFNACFYAFFPSPILKWNHLCYMLYNIKEGSVAPNQIRELTATCTAMCQSQSLRDVLQYIVPMTQNYTSQQEARRSDSKTMKDVPCKSATVPRSSHAPKPPPVPPRAKDSHKSQEGEGKSSYLEWQLLDVVPRLLDVVLNPIKQQLSQRQCATAHDHGELQTQERLADSCCKLAARIIAEMSFSALMLREEVESRTMKPIISPPRFMRVNSARTWSTGNGSPEAICFTIDRRGVALAGACVYAGAGHYDYFMELLYDIRTTTEDANQTHCWVTEVAVEGSFSAADANHDMVQIKFETPVLLKEDTLYALRLSCEGARTASGDCGLPAVTGPDGTTFQFSSCPLSFNGTTLARGQLPCLIYFRTSTIDTLLGIDERPCTTNSDIANTGRIETDIATIRKAAVAVATLVAERAAMLLAALRGLSIDDLRRIAPTLATAPALNTLLPFALANLEGLHDSKSVIRLLELVHKLLPHVAAMNLMIPSSEEITNTTTSHYYTWLESDHPYKQATVTNKRVLFPPQVAWIVLEMDPRSITAQPEDTLTIYAVAGAPKHRCHCTNDTRMADPPFRKRIVQLTSESGEAEELEETISDAPCMHYSCTYLSVTPKLSNIPSDWPQKALLIPGNEVIFSLETASDYLNGYNKSNNEESRFGFRCLCVGYEDAPVASARAGCGMGLATLEMELVHLGASCAARLLAPEVDLPPLTRAIVAEVQMQAMITNGGSGGTCVSGVAEASGEACADESEALMLSRGLELASPPAIHNVLDGQPLLRSVSTERQFLSDFVAGHESTAGGRLARWLAPASRVEPARCEIKAPMGPVKLSAILSLPIFIRDQYGDSVVSPTLKVKVVVQRLETRTPRRDPLSPEELGTIINAPYQPTVEDNSCFQAITVMEEYKNFSFEELRYARGAFPGARRCYESAVGIGRIPTERIVVDAQRDGSYIAVWSPRAFGSYILRCTLDDVPTSQDLKVEVVQSVNDDSAAERWIGATAPYRLRRFAIEDSAGLRLRTSPSLQAEELGRVPSGAYIAVVEELVNKDGTWVRLSAESAKTYTEGSAEVAWCLQFHGHLDRTLLVPVDDDDAQEEMAPCWSGYTEAQLTELPSGTDDEADAASNDLSTDDRRFPFSIQCDLANESDSSTSPYLFGEPSKRGRLLRNEANSVIYPRIPPLRTPRRSNGNSYERWSPVKHRSSDNVRNNENMEETEILEIREQNVKPNRMAQTGTQTSPENMDRDDLANSRFAPKEERESPKRFSREHLVHSRSRRSISPPALPARSSVPRKHALSPAQAECVRAVFAALLWHEGIVHDAIACAAFLKFHPTLPKAGARVVTRPPHDVPLPRPQRHSVEVSNAGQYHHIHSSTLETLTRSGIEASTSRARKSDINLPIHEEDASHAADSAPSPSVVNVLPPALRALVALWDALNEADQLTAATDKFKKDMTEKNENGDPGTTMGFKPDVKKNTRPKVIRSVKCELCGGDSVFPPLADHMRKKHPGCHAPTTRGYDRVGVYKQADSVTTGSGHGSECGVLAQDLIGVKIRATLSAYQLWYIYCEKCRDRALKATSRLMNKPSVEAERAPVTERAISEVDHLSMRDNALFLLDLAPLTNSEPSSASCWRELGGRSPPTPPGSVWQPAPPFQCLTALGAAPKSVALPDTARYHSLGRPMPAAQLLDQGPSTTGTSGGQWSRVPRSVSMGQAGGRDLAHAARPPSTSVEADPQDTLSGAGSSLLAQPSAALQKLVGVSENEGCSVSAFEAPRVDPQTLMQSPVLGFILGKRDLPACRQKIDAAVRINTVRQYAFESLNWMLRSTTQPTSVHDVMWWFCNALEQYARIEPPPLVIEDNKENAVIEWNRGAVIPTASAAAICPGGRAARGSRAAFHAFLGSISALAPSLPPASAAALQAVRCWALHYSAHDRAFLHRSQVFSVISKILSHAEDGAYDEGVLGALHESYHSYINKQQNFIWSCPDVTGWCEVSVSSRSGMAGALTDGSTETFWESGDEDRNRAKWLQVSYAGPSYRDKPHVLCIHVDNTRDTANKTLLMSFLYSGGTSDMSHMQDIDVDPKAATWVCYTLPRSSSSSVRVRCELRGPEPAVRVRQVRVLGAPAATPDSTEAHPLHLLAERDTLRVFRLLTSQVFGKLLESDLNTSSESGEGAAAEEAAGDDSDLREHVVGILFAGHKLTSLQQQVMSHIVCAIGCEATRVRDDWETTLLCAEVNERDGQTPRAPLAHHSQDNYCFEMLSLLLALSGSAVGRAHLAQRTELLVDLLALLHTGSERVQRQVISLLRRMIAEVPPQKMLSALNYGGDMTARVTLLDHLVCYVGKAMTVQVKVKGAGATSPGTVTLGGSVTPAPPAAWFMRGETTQKHAHLVARLISDMAEDKVSDSWGLDTRTALAQYVRAVAQIEESDRHPARCIASPTVWLALASLSVCDHHHIELMNRSNEGRESRGRDSVAEARPHCSNHDDGSTLAVIECRSCGALCSECDRFLHLNRAARNHQRQICKEEESAIRIDIHEGCGRAKLFWLLLLVDRRTLKALVEFRSIDGAGTSSAGAAGTAGGAGDGEQAGLAGTCRFCGARGNSGLLAIGNVCADQQCQEHGREACSRVLGCGHPCGGVRGERSCLPCLFGCAGAESLRQDADDMCMVCFTDPLQAAPAIQLSCGHVFHLHCCKKVLANKWVGPRITFSFAQCPICKEDMVHWTLEELLAPIRRLCDEVRRKALMRLEYEGLGAGGSRGRSLADPATYAMERYAYYVCHKCGKAYFGGLARCEVESSGWWEPTELVCGACSDVAGARVCPKHAADFLEYKCRYCCSVAVFFCFGTSHFCNACHDDFQRVTNIPRHLLPQCPAGPKGEQLPGTSDECPLHVQHPPTGEEFALGCGVCRHAHSF